MKKRIFIAVPQYRTMPMEQEMALAKHFGFDNWSRTGFHPMFSLSLAGLKQTEHEYVVNSLQGDGMIERSRATLFGIWLSEWKKGNKYDYFWMLDEDIQFHQSAVDSMIAADKGIIGGAYSFKVDHGPKAGRSVCKAFSNIPKGPDGIREIRWLNGGFIFARADALFQMMEHHPELRYQRFPDAEGDDLEVTESYAFWCAIVHTIEDGSRILLSEDYAFCEQARKAGIGIYLDTKIHLAHWGGTMSYKLGTPRYEERNIDGVVGWMSEKELAWLKEEATNMTSIVEIGCWRGRSTRVLLDNCKGDVYAVDHWQGSPKCITKEIAVREDVYSVFMKNVGHYPNLRVMMGSSEEGAEHFNGGKVDMVFIDGDHRHEAVKKDISLWLPKCTKLISGHDYRETFRAVHEMLGHVNVVGDIWFKRLEG